jgi:hypothetical protein
MQKGTKENCNRDRRVTSVANRILKVMREHSSRAEAIDAHDMARILFRKESSLRIVSQPSPGDHVTLP